MLNLNGKKITKNAQYAERIFDTSSKYIKEIYARIMLMYQRFEVYFA